MFLTTSEQFSMILQTWPKISEFHSEHVLCAKSQGLAGIEPLSLGAGGITPRVNWEFFESFLIIYPDIAQGVNSEHFQRLLHTLISICSLGKLRNCSERTLQFALQVIDWKNPGFLSQICSKFAHKIPEPLIQSYFINYSECVQPHTHWVCSKNFKENSQFGSVFQQTLKELIE